MIKFENHTNYNCKITTDDGQEYYVFSHWLHNNDLDHWKGWSCDAGYSRLHIDKNLEVWSGVCYNDYLGKATDNFYTNKRTVCRRETCTPCTDDLVIGKASPGHSIE